MTINKMLLLLNIEPVLIKKINKTIAMCIAPKAVKSHFLPRIDVIWGRKFLFTVFF